MSLEKKCGNGHDVRMGENFCGDCGLPTNIQFFPECLVCGLTIENATFCTNCGSKLQSKHTPSNTVFNVGPYGRNHEAIATAVRPLVGQVLSTDQIWQHTKSVDPTFNKGSLLPNDHAGGNRGSCNCSEYKSGINARPLFKRVGPGRYLVLEVGESETHVISQPRKDSSTTEELVSFFDIRKNFSK